MKRSHEEGFALVLSLVSMIVFILLGTAVYKITRTLVYESLFQKRVVQSQSIAEAGMEDALYQLHLDPNTRTGFTKNFAGGSYTVSYSADTPPWVTSVGRSVPIHLFGTPHTTIRALAQIVSSSSSTACTSYSATAATFNGLMNAYDSSVSTSPSTFGFGGHFCSNTSMSVANTGGITVNANVSYFSGSAPPASRVGGTVTKTTFTWTLPAYDDGSAYVNSNNNASISSSRYTASTKSLSIPAGITVTISSGVYYFNAMSILGTLKADTSTGTVVIYANSNLSLPSGGAIINTSGIPSRLLIAPQGARTITLQSTTPLYALLYGRSATLTVSQTLFGNIIASRVTISSSRVFHFDKSLIPSTPSRVSWTPASWSANPQ
jgi:hypothetical protein